MRNFNVMTRRSFLDRSFKTGLAVALSTLTDIPFVMKRALAEGSIGLNGKKILFIWLRLGNDGLNNVIPVEDPQYAAIRSTIEIQKDSAEDYTASNVPCFSPVSSPTAGDATFNTYWYNKAIRLGNGFAGLHPALKFLAPVYNDGDLALIHRVAYPKQSRSHFDSQNYWETGNPNNNLSKDGIFYRTIMESGLAHTAPLTGISIQSSLPLILRGSDAAMTNLTSPTRYDLLGIPTTTGDNKAFNALAGSNYYPFAGKRNRDLLELQYQNMSNTLRIFGGIDFNDSGNIFRDNIKTDGDTGWYPGASNDSQGYYLFPNTDNKNGGYRRPGAPVTFNTNKRVVPQGQQGFFTNLKAAAMILNKTDALIAGTELAGFDLHGDGGAATGSQANLLQVVGWSMYALQKYFSNYQEKVGWEDVVVVTFSEFGRTSEENGTFGTDHAEAGLMYVAGGAVKGYNQGNPSGVFGCSPTGNIPWKTGPRDPDVNKCGTLYAASPGTQAGYLRRSSDYRSVLGEIIRKHMGATQNQLNKIIPAYAVPGERLLSGGTSSVDGTPIHGELGIL